MQTDVQPQHTIHLTRAGLWGCLLPVALVALAGLIVLIFQQPLFLKYLLVKKDKLEVIGPIPLKQQLFGSLRLDVAATIPNNRWLTYQVRLRDPQNNLIDSTVKHTWNESTFLYKEGTAGSWETQELQRGLDIPQARQHLQAVKIEIAVLSYTNASGQEINETVPFQVAATNWVADWRYLLMGAVGVAGLSLASFTSFGNGGKRVIYESIGDSDVGGRGLVGGPNSLVQVMVGVISDETSPKGLNVHLWIKDENGLPVYQDVVPMWLRFKTDDEGEIEEARGKIEGYFLLERRGSYGFYVEVMPDAPVDRTWLSVRDGIQSLNAIETVQIA